MKEKHPGDEPVGKKLSNQQIFQKNTQKIEEKILELEDLRKYVLLSREEKQKLDRIIADAGNAVSKALNSIFLQAQHNRHLVHEVAPLLDAEITALHEKRQKGNREIVLADLEKEKKEKELELEQQAAQEKEEKLNQLPEILFHYLFENADRFASDAAVRKEAEQFIQSYYTELAQLMGHDLGEKDFQKTLTIFSQLKLENNLDKDKWTKMLGMLLDVDTLRTPEGIGTWLRANSYLSKKFINSNVADLTNEDIVNIFKIAFSNDQVRMKFKDNLPKKESNELGIQTALFNGFETIIFPHRDPFIARPDHISSERCQALAVAVQETVFMDGPKVQAEQSKEEEKEAEKEEENSGARLSAGLQKIEGNATEIERLTDSVEKTRSTSTRLPLPPQSPLAPDSPISPIRAVSSPCRVQPTPTGEVETKSALVR